MAAATVPGAAGDGTATTTITATEAGGTPTTTTAEEIGIAGTGIGTTELAEAGPDVPAIEVLGPITVEANTGRVVLAPAEGHREPATIAVRPAIIRGIVWPGRATTATTTATTTTTAVECKKRHVRDLARKEAMS